MTPERRKYTRAPASQRRQDLMRATLHLIAEAGLHGATVRAIADRAQVTPGLIRHHFRSKEDLVLAAYDHHMRCLTDLSFAPAEAAAGARARLTTFVRAALTAPVVDAGAVGLWAGFLGQMRFDPALQAIHARTYHDFRDRLQALIAAALADAQQPCSPAAARRLAIAGNAVIDGLWMEGGALPQGFAAGELPDIGLEAVGAIIGLDLRQEEGPNP